MSSKDNGGIRGPLPPIPQDELDLMIAKAEQQAREFKSPVHGNLGVIDEEQNETPLVGVPFLPRYATPRARKPPAVAMTPKLYCDLCGHVDEHARGCPAVAKPPETVNIAELAKKEPSIRRELKRIAVGFLRRLADRLGS